MALHRRLAYVPGDVTLWPELSGGEVIDLLGRLRGTIDPKRRASLLERFDLDPRKKARTYSKGNRQKVALIAALAADVELLVLDESTSGLDPLMEGVFRECVAEERARGRTMLLSSHILAEVEAVCDRVTIIRQGCAVETGSLAELRHLTRTMVSAVVNTLPAGIERLPGIYNLAVDGSQLSCEVDSQPAGWPDARAGNRRAAQPGLPAADARRPVPASLPGGHRAECGPMNGLSGTGRLIRLILRRDWLKLLIWVFITVAVPIGVASSFKELYPTAAAIQAYARESMATPAAVGMLGLVYAQTLGGLVAWRTGLNSAILIAPVSLLFIIRHTRTEEEAGRRELVGATAVGRSAPLTAALGVVLGADLLIGLLIAAGLAAQGLPAAGSLALGLSAASSGWVFAALAAAAAQLTTSPGPARGMALGGFGLAYVLRAVGDAASLNAQPDWASWLSPLGWVRFTRAFAGEQWGVFALLLGLTAVLAAAAYRLSERRDLGAGLLPARPGPAGAAPQLSTPLGLAWRLNRGGLVAWTAAAALFGILLGSTGSTFNNFVDGPRRRAGCGGWARRTPEKPSSLSSSTSWARSSPLTPSAPRCAYAPKSSMVARTRCWRPGSAARAGLSATWSSPSPGRPCCCWCWGCSSGWGLG